MLGGSDLIFDVIKVGDLIAEIVSELVRNDVVRELMVGDCDSRQLKNLKGGEKSNGCNNVRLTNWVVREVQDVRDLRFDCGKQTREDVLDLQKRGC